MRPKKKIRLGDLLVENKVISQRQLESALADQRKSGRKLGRVLIDNGYIKESSLLEFLSHQLHIPFVDLDQHKFDPDVVRLVPEMLARRFRAVALHERRGELFIGMADPTDIFAYDELTRVLGRSFSPAVISEGALLKAFDSVYRRTEDIESFAEALNDELSERDVDLGELGQSDNVNDAPVVRLIQSLFEDAVQVGASDVHVEPGEKVLRIRQRVDGLLHEQVMEERRIAAALVLRLKLMAGLDISEKRLPQDGRFSVKVRGKTVDVRISTMPLRDGEAVVMRLLDQDAGLLDLGQLGLSEHTRARIERGLVQQQGMLLVTGPTGSGKTTTIYSALGRLNVAERKIITVEDPVEYRIDRINQVQVHTEIGLTFARVLRGVLRLDPDVVFVGEMRDEETVEIGLRAAMTGHLVLSTLHTNDAIGTVNRLMDMKAEGFLLASTLNLVVSQRLVRRVCENCVEPYQPRAHELAWLEQVFPECGPRVTRLVRGRGCGQCQDMGYRGRIGIHEVLEMDEGLRAPLSAGDDAGFRELAMARLAGATLADAALEQAIAGHTSFDEVLRVTGVSELDEAPVERELAPAPWAGTQPLARSA